MLKYLLILFLLFCCTFGTWAQQSDSLFAIRNNADWAIKYVVAPGETKQMLTKRYYLQDGELENYNAMDNTHKLSSGENVYIPIDSRVNYYISKPTTIESENYHELYYKVIPKDDIETISTYAGVAKATMRTWNNLHGNTLLPGRVLFIGWVKMIAFDTANPFCNIAYYIPKKKTAADTPKVMVPGGLDTIYNRQTNGGINVLAEKGTAVFFEKSSRNGVYYAFHNSTPRNTIIKVYNPGTSKTIYVKVLGPVPNTKLYANSIIGISSAAKDALGVTENKAWCELSYSTN